MNSTVVMLLFLQARWDVGNTWLQVDGLVDMCVYGDRMLGGREESQFTSAKRKLALQLLSVKQ